MPDTLNVALTSPELARKVEADANGAEISSEAIRAAPTSPDRNNTLGIDNGNPSLLGDAEMGAPILSTIDLLSAAGLNLPKFLSNDGANVIGRVIQDGNAVRR